MSTIFRLKSLDGSNWVDWGQSYDISDERDVESMIRAAHLLGTRDSEIRIEKWEEDDEYVQERKQALDQFLNTLNKRDLLKLYNFTNILHEVLIGGEVE